MSLREGTATMAAAAAAAIVLAVATNAVSGVSVREVKAGETAKLPCLSNDENHRFQYWQLVNEEIIGPWNNGNERKFRYEVTTGQLTIEETSQKESGLYKCFSKSLTDPSLHVEGVELIVKHDWEETYEGDPSVTTYRALIAFFCFLILLLFGIFIFVAERRKSRRGNLVEEDREGSPGASMLPRVARGTYNPTTVAYSSSGRKKTGNINGGMEIETDLRNSFPLPEYD